MSRRRPPSNPNLGRSNMLNESPKLSKAQRHRPQQSVEQPNLGMSPEARYNHNLKVLRRRDPSIISIFDQFSHVCVYHHNGQTWEKNGFEGSMFLYESDSYPPYGFYILNRMGMDDYIQRLYPEDVTGIHGTYLMLRSYPDFTNRRISHVLASYNETPGKFSDAWAVPNLDKLLDGDKGRAHTVGLWMFPTDAREPMIDVMIRLHSYVKQNISYPEQFRYGPNKPPPPNPHLRTTSPSPPPEPNGPPSGENMTVASLFASLNNSNLDETPPPTSPTSQTGIALLDSIFASATAGPSTSAPAPAASIPIHSPTPTTSVLPPQILNHEVITTLLGLPPSRSASVSTSYSSDARSHTSSREGDNEYEESGSNPHAGSDGFSESTTVLDPEAELDEELQAAGSSTGRPLLSVPTPRSNPHSLPVNGSGAVKVNGKGRAHGDVTPRAPVPPSSVNGHRPAGPSRAPVPPPMGDPTISTSTVRPQSRQQTRAQPPAVRHPSTTFAAGSELWPGARAPVDDRSADADGFEDGEIVELDFEDTSALSDPDVFRQVLQQRGARRNPDAESSSQNAAGADASPAGARERRDRGKGRKKGKRERAAERAAEIGHQRSLEATRLLQMIDSSSRLPLGLASTSSSRSASASPSPERLQPSRPAVAPLVFAEAESPTTAHPSKIQTMVAIVNGSSSSSAPRAPAATGLDPVKARAAIISSFTSEETRGLPPMEKNAFMRELLTLIHTDKAFVDALWQDYTTRMD
ncbi:hypothetical protein MSAN_02386500 [Mycena sanguinolenta]|uniref:Uncharacterized protein n=1 Tax=Mycena sanguinolenta TaxID=230812 RepID=A0A8H6X4Y8_9AGAR|nr:hypothetical protein MSAN_02386500 [Mycena sanguinolenta]